MQKKGGDACKLAADMYAANLNWLSAQVGRKGTFGDQPYTQAQIDKANESCLKNAAKATIDGAKLETKPLTATGSIWSKLLKW